MLCMETYIHALFLLKSVPVHITLIVFCHRFSCDEGVTWNTYKIFHNDTDRMSVVGLLTEIGERAVHAT